MDTRASAAVSDARQITAALRRVRTNMSSSVMNADEAVSLLLQDGAILEDTLQDHKYGLKGSLQTTKYRLARIKSAETRERYSIFLSLSFFTSVVIYIVAKRTRILTIAWLAISGAIRGKEFLSTMTAMIPKNESPLVMSSNFDKEMISEFTTSAGSIRDGKDISYIREPGSKILDGVQKILNLSKEQVKREQIVEASSSEEFIKGDAVAEENKRKLSSDILAANEMRRQEAIKKEEIRQEGIRTAAIRSEEVRQEEIRKEETRKEVIRTEDARKEAMKKGEASKEEIRKEEASKEAMRKVEEVRKEEAIRKAEETRQEAIRKAEETRQEAIRKAEEVRKEEAIRKAEETRQEAIRKAEETRQEAIRKEEEIRKAEETRQEAIRKAEETRQEAIRKAEETRQEAIRKEIGRAHV